MNRAAVGLQLNPKGFLFDSTTGSSYTLNWTGTSLLQRVLDGAVRTELVAYLKTQFHLDEKNAVRDLDRFFLDLQNLGLVVEEV